MSARLGAWARAAAARPARWWRFWVTLFDRREPGTALACFRIATGLVMLYSLLSVGLAGMIDVLWVDHASGGYAYLGTGNWLLERLGGPTPAVIHALYGVSLAGTLLVIAGAGGRLSILVALQAYTAMALVNGDASGGYDLLITNAMWLLVLGDATATLSVRCRRRTGRWTCDAEVPAWPRYLAVFQLLVMYATTGMHKLSADWLPAGGWAALYRVFQDPTWRRFDMQWTAWVYPLTQVATAVTWLFEVTAPLMLVWYYCRYTRERPGRLRARIQRRDLRIPFAALGLSLHIGILVTLNVGPFSLATLAYYVCLWHPDELARAAARLRRQPAQP